MSDQYSEIAQPPPNLHPPAPLQSAVLLVRRQIVEQALILMMTRELVAREVDKEGIRYVAGENAAPFLAALESEYLRAMYDRANWLADALTASSLIVKHEIWYSGETAYRER